MRVEQLLEGDRFAVLLGARLVEATPTRVVVEMEIAAHHRDASGTVSAGVLFSLADCAMSLISNAEVTAVAVAAHFVRGSRAVPGGTVRAVAEPELPVGDDPATTWTVTLSADGTVVASFTGTTLRLDR